MHLVALELPFARKTHPNTTKYMTPRAVRLAASSVHPWALSPEPYALEHQALVSGDRYFLSHDCTSFHHSR